MPDVIERQKRPVRVRTLLWDGDNPKEVTAFCGKVRGASVLAFQPPISPGGIARVYNIEERDWINVPVGHYLIQGLLGEFYPVSPAALELTYEPVADEGDDADQRLFRSEQQGAETRVQEQHDR